MSFLSTLAGPWSKRLADYIHEHRELFTVALVAGGVLAFIVLSSSVYLWRATGMTEAVEGGRMAYRRLAVAESRCAENKEMMTRELAHIAVSVAETRTGIADLRDGLGDIRQTQRDILRALIGGARPVLAAAAAITNEKPREDNDEECAP